MGLLLLGTCGALSSLWAQIPAFDWVRAAGGPAQDAAQGVAVDSIGNVYVTGYVHDRAFIGTGYVGTSGDCCAKMFLTKQDSAGNYLWARSANLNVSDNPYRFNQAIVADPSGAVYVVGVFSGTTVFGSISLSASDVYSLYVVKYSASGSALWAVRAGPIHSGPSPGVSVTIASDGSVHVASSFEATASFGNTNMTSGGYGDICHAKYNSTNGTLIWVTKAGGAREDAGMAIAADGAANTYLAGQYEGPASFGRAR